MRILGSVLIAAVLALSACSSGGGDSGPSSSSPSSSGSAPVAPDSPSYTKGTEAISPPTDGGSTSATTKPVPAAPLRTINVIGTNGDYVVKLWAQVKDATCFDHAYGKAMIAFLTKHPCTGLQRVLGTTTVKGRAVGFAESATGFAGTAKDPYVNSSAFTKLVTKDGTGNLDDLFRDGYRLPSGPKTVPTPDAFNVVGQDDGVTVWDVWYLDGATPNNDKALVAMTMDLFLRF